MKNKIHILLVIILLPIKLSGQNKYKKPIEISAFYSIAVSHSFLSNKINPNVTSPPSISAFNYGIKADRLISKDSNGLLICASLFGMDLGVGTKTNIYSGRLMSYNSLWEIPHFLVYGLGLKKVQKYTDHRKIKFNCEIGVRFIKSIKGAQTIETKDFIGFDTVIYRREFTFNKQRSLTLVPYIGIGADFNYRKLKIGLQFWAQRGFQTIYQYNFTLKNNNFNYETKVSTNGLSWGAFVYLRMFRF